MNGENDTLHDDVRAAFESVAKSEGIEAPEFPKGASEVLPPVKLEEESESGRDSQGRFLPKDKTPQSPEVPVPEAKAPEKKPEGQEVTPPEKPDPNAPVKLDPSKPPQAFSQPIKDKWATIPEDVRAEIIKREEDMAAGVTRLQKQMEPMAQVFGAVAPHAQYFQHIQMHPAQYIENMIRAEQTLTLGNPAQKFGKILELADDYGIPLRKALDEAMGGKLDAFLQESHKFHKTPPQLPPEVARELQEQRSWRDQIESQAAQSELQAFEADTKAHPFFKEVREKMADLIESGAADTYEDAYQICVYRDPALRARALAQENAAAQQNGIAQRQAAAGALVPPSSAPITPPGTGIDGDDTYADVRRAIANLNGRA
jgi:hypothetical protein